MNKSIFPYEACGMSLNVQISDMDGIPVVTSVTKFEDETASLSLPLPFTLADEDEVRVEEALMCQNAGCVEHLLEQISKLVVRMAGGDAWVKTAMHQVVSQVVPA